MKKLFRILFVLIVCLGLCSCGKKTDGLSNGTSKNDKGSRTNPYKVGETIEIKNATSPVDAGDDNEAANGPYNITLVVDEVYSPEEGMAMQEQYYTVYGEYPCAKAHLYVEGDYPNALYYLFMTHAFEDGMQIIGTNCKFNLSDPTFWNEVFTGVDYEFYIMAPCDSETNEFSVMKYWRFMYYDKDGNQPEIYIQLN